MIYNKSQSDSRNSELMTFRVSQSRVLECEILFLPTGKLLRDRGKRGVGVHSYSIFDSIYSPLEAQAFVNVDHEQPEIANTSLVYS